MTATKKRGPKPQPAEKITTPYVLERWDTLTSFGRQYYFRIRRFKGGKTIFLSHPYNSKQIRATEIVTQMNNLFRPDAITIVDVQQ